MARLQQRVLILGHGAMGTMFEQLLGTHHDVSIWERDLETGEETAALESVAGDRDIVLFALPAHPHEELASRLDGHLLPDAVCLSIAKGVDAQARTPASIFEQTLGQRHHWGMIYGPMIARDLKRGRRGFAVLAAASKPARQAAELFDGTALFLDTDDDVHGATWAVILKNVFVPLIGAADALDLGDNVRGFLLAEALRELEAIVAERGGRPETARGLAGLGDLITSATSQSSHHRTIGAELVAGKRDRVAASGEYIRSEGVHTAMRIREHGVLPTGRYHLFDLACDFLVRSIDLETELMHYFEHRFERVSQ